MKVALYIEDGSEQIILTPESDSEENILTGITSESEISVVKGAFYRCRGGWIREHDFPDSTMIVIRPKTTSPTSTEAKKT